MKKNVMNTMREGFTSYPFWSFFLVPLIICAAIAILMPALSQGQAPKVKVETTSARDTNEVAGSKLFHSYCAVCHGQDAKGNGPAAPGLKTAPADLTLLSKKKDGKFPGDYVMNVLSSDEQSTLHGSKDMPIWGPTFRRTGDNPDLGRLRAYNVTQYLKSIQAK